MAQVLGPQTRSGARYQSHQQHQSRHSSHSHTSHTQPNTTLSSHSQSHHHSHPHSVFPSSPSLYSLSPRCQKSPSQTSLACSRSPTRVSTKSSNGGYSTKKLTMSSSARSLTDLAASTGSAGLEIGSSHIPQSAQIGRSRSMASLSSFGMSGHDSKQPAPQIKKRSGTPPASPSSHTRSHTHSHPPSLNHPSISTSHSSPLPTPKSDTSPRFLASTLVETTGVSPPKRLDGTVRIPRIRRRKHPGLIRSASLSAIPKLTALIPLTSLSASQEERLKENDDPNSSSFSFPTLARSTGSYTSLNTWGSRDSSSRNLTDLVLPSLRSIMSLDDDEDIGVEPDEVGFYDYDVGSDDDDDDGAPCRKKRTYKSRIKQLRHIRRRKSNGEWMDEDDSDFYSSGDEDAPHEPYQAEDDCAILRPDPDRQVDYLSHEWCEEEVSISWRVIVSKRWYYGDRSRLENASWRSWAKHKYGLKVLNPQELNWYKDEDSSHLYGPFLPKAQPKRSPGDRPPQPAISSNTRPILKKRANSEVVLFNSRSAISLLRDAANRKRWNPLKSSEEAVSPTFLAALDLQKRPSLALHRRHSDRPHSPHVDMVAPLCQIPSQIPASMNRTRLQISSNNSHSRHIRFSPTVTQCRAIPLSDHEDEEDPTPAYPPPNRNMLSKKFSIGLDNSSDSESGSESDDGMVIEFRPRLAEINAHRIASRTSLASANIDPSPALTPSAPLKLISPVGGSPYPPIIVMLPPTVLRSDGATSKWMSGNDSLLASGSGSVLKASTRTAHKGKENHADSGSGDDSDDVLEMTILNKQTHPSKVPTAPREDAELNPGLGSTTSVTSSSSLVPPYHAKPVEIGPTSSANFGSQSKTVTAEPLPQIITNGLLEGNDSTTVDDESPLSATEVVIGKVIDGLQTLKDIAHVIWNVSKARWEMAPEA